MFCPQCGNEVEQHFQFCSRCGQNLAAAAAAATTPAGVRNQRGMASHVQVLGWLFVGSGVLTGLLGFVVIFAGTFIRSMDINWPANVPFDVERLAVGATILAGMGMLALASGTIAAGVGLLQYRGWGRVLAIVMAVFLLFKFPVGTAIAVYAFWVLLSDPGRAHYRGHTAIPQS